MFNLFKKNTQHENLKQVKDFILEHSEEFSINKEKISQDVFDVTMFFFKEVLDLYESMDILIQKDHFRGFLPISRSLLENSINIQYIYDKDTENRAKNFKLASIDKFLKRHKGQKYDEPECKEMESKFKEMLKDYVPGPRMTIEDKFKQVNSHSLYKDEYKRLCEYVHSDYKGPRDLNDNGPYPAYLRRLVFSDTLLVVLEALKSICERFDLEGGVMVIDDPGYKGKLFYSTNPKKSEEVMRNKEKLH